MRYSVWCIEAQLYDDGWVWNNKFRLGEYDGDPDDSAAMLRWLVEHDHLDDDELDNIKMESWSDYCWEARRIDNDEPVVAFILEEE